jgi:orotidine-5'-phosphate decarboxylase
MTKIFCALDTPDLEKAKVLASGLARLSGVGLKLGLEFFSAQGPQGVRLLREGFPDLPIFLDLKFHDIPNTTAQALRAVVPLGVSFLNLHASGGLEMMRAAKDAVADEAVKSGVARPKLLAVTVLTSLDETLLSQVGQALPVEGQVLRLARLTKESGLDGVVCSAKEIAALRGALGPDFTLMVPGIRPAGADVGDQKRVMTPKEAIDAGASHLVIGRPITGAPDPAMAAQEILTTL